MEPRASLDVVVINDDLEALALRAALEWWQVQITLHLIGQAKDVVHILGKGGNKSKLIFLMCHGNEQGIILPELGPEVEKEQPYHQVLTPTNLTEFLHLPGCIVVNTGCITGTPAFAQAFLDASCTAYIGPTDYPSGDSSLFYVLHLCYGWIASGRSLNEAHALTISHDAGTQMFHLFEQEPGGGM